MELSFKSTALFLLYLSLILFVPLFDIPLLLSSFSPTYRALTPSFTQSLSHHSPKLTYARSWKQQLLLKSSRNIPCRRPRRGRTALSQKDPRHLPVWVPYSSSATSRQADLETIGKQRCAAFFPARPHTKINSRRAPDCAETR